MHIVDILAFAPPKLRETPLTWVEPACPLNHGKSVHVITTQFPSILCSSYSMFNCQDSWLTCMSSLAPKVCRKGTISQRFWPVGCLSSRHLCTMTAATCFSCAGSTSRPLPLQDVWASSISWLTGSTQQDTLASSAVNTFFPDLPKNQSILSTFPTDIAESVNSQFSPLGHVVHRMNKWFCQLFLQAGCAGQNEFSRKQVSQAAVLGCQEMCDVHNLARLQALADRARARRKRGPPTRIGAM